MKTTGKSALAGARVRARKKPLPASKAAAPAAKKVSGVWINGDEFEHLQESLREAQETLNAIRSGEVDAVVVSGANGNQIYSLAGAEQPYRVYVEQMQEGAVTVSPEAVVLYCNQRFATMVGLPLERVISSDLREFLSDETWTKLAGVFGRTDEVMKHEDALRGADDRTLPVHLTASQLPVEAQEVMCLIVTDLTGQKEQVELRLAKELAEKANLAKDSFLAALSHELRTPLNPALMAAVALEQDETMPLAARRQLAMIRRNIELEARLIDDLLDVTRIAQGKLELQNAPVELHAVILRALEICRPDVEAKDQQFVINLEATQTRTMGDGVRIQQVMWNLIRNASKFTQAGGTISIRTGNDGTKRIWAQVTDTGIGFTPDAAPKMFLAFEQGGRHITRQFGGLGLGLAISRSIAEAHGGTIRAESPGSGHGATFTLELPVYSAETPPKPAESAHAPAAKAAPATGLRILLVEDHRDTRTSMEFLLRRSKHHVRSAETAREALELAEREAFDVVVTDLGLPDQSGLELMRQLRDRHGLKGIATSGYGMEEDIANGREAGFVQHFTKPISMERLRQVLAELKAKKESGDS